tara:strand:+ start:31417 stop:32016 length:600 start_codon:yes stop_codon:yes gene_type:complete
MKVDHKLLEKYYNGFCSKEEKNAVESWLASNTFDDSEFIDLPKGESKMTHKQKMWQDISQVVNKPVVKVIPLFKELTKYAAVACIIAAVFFAGRYSTTTNMAIEPQNNLLVYGGNGTHAKIPGNEFSLQFDGQLKLFNGSKDIKKVTVGNKIYTLEPMKTYFLMGNNQKSSLVAGLDFEIEERGLAQLKGDFGIKILKA